LQESSALFLPGTGEESGPGPYTNRSDAAALRVRFEGIFNNLQRRYEETGLGDHRERIEGPTWRSSPCPQVPRRPAAAGEGLAVKVGGISIAREYSDPRRRKRAIKRMSS